MSGRRGEYERKEEEEEKEEEEDSSQASKSEYISTHVYRNRRVNPSFTRGSSLERSQRRGFQFSDYYSKLVEQLRSSKKDVKSDEFASWLDSSFLQGK